MGESGCGSNPILAWAPPPNSTHLIHVSLVLSIVLVAVVFLHISSVFGLLKAPQMSWEVSRALASMIAVNVIGLSLNTLCLQYVDASFYQVARSLILPFTVLLMHFYLQKRSSGQVILACAIVCVGFLTGVRGEFELSWIGVVFGVLSSLTTAFHAVLIKSSLEVVNQNTMDLVFYNNVLTAVFLFPLVLISGEVSPFLTNVVFSGDGSNQAHFLVGLLITVSTSSFLPALRPSLNPPTCLSLGRVWVSD